MCTSEKETEQDVLRLFRSHTELLLMFYQSANTSIFISAVVCFVLCVCMELEPLTSAAEKITLKVPVFVIVQS